MIGHGILKCSCGVVVQRCRCPGPHPTQFVANACERCKEAIAREHSSPLANDPAQHASTSVLPAEYKLTDDDVKRIAAAVAEQMAKNAASAMAAGPVSVTMQTLPARRPFISPSLLQFDDDQDGEG